MMRSTSGSAGGRGGGVDGAFNRWLGRGAPAYVEKRLPTFRAVAELVHSVGGIVSAAHLKARGTRTALAAFKAEGLDAVATRHPGHPRAAPGRPAVQPRPPGHNGEARARLTGLAQSLDLLRTGGSDWHGDLDAESTHALMGSQEGPAEWLSLVGERAL